MKVLLPKLTARLKEYREDAKCSPVPRYKPDVPQEADERISHSYFWPRLGQFFKEGDIIISETGKYEGG